MGATCSRHPSQTKRPCKEKILPAAAVLAQEAVENRRRRIQDEDYNDVWIPVGDRELQRYSATALRERGAAQRYEEDHPVGERELHIYGERGAMQRYQAQIDRSQPVTIPVGYLELCRDSMSRARRALNHAVVLGERMAAAFIEECQTISRAERDLAQFIPQ